MPRLFQTAYGAGRQAHRIRAQDGGQGLGEVVGRDALEVKQGDQCLQGGRAAHVGGQDVAGEPPAVPAVVHTGLGHCDIAQARLDRALGLMAVAHDHAASRLRITKVAVLCDVVADLRLDGHLEHLPGPLPQYLVQGRPGLLLDSLSASNAVILIHERILPGPPAEGRFGETKTPTTNPRRIRSLSSINNFREYLPRSRRRSGAGQASPDPP